MRRRRTFRRKTTVRRRRYLSRTGGRRFRTKRILRRLIKSHKTEYKYAERPHEVQTVANVFTSLEITPDQISRGTGPTQRIGNSVKYISVTVKAHLDIQQNVNNISYSNVRVVFYTPLVDTDTATAYMNQQSNLSYLDFDIVKVHSDRRYLLSNNVQGNLTAANGTAMPLYAGFPASINIFKKFLFPRKVEFVNDASTLVDGRDKIFMFVLGTNSPINVSVNARTVFIDP